MPSMEIKPASLRLPPLNYKAKVFLCINQLYACLFLDKSSQFICYIEDLLTSKD